MTTTATTRDAWTFKQFNLAMRRAGWRLSSAQGFFEHKMTLKHFNPYNVTAGQGEWWREWAARQETPEP